MPTLIDWVYAASFIDGEGCISMFWSFKKRPDRKENKIYGSAHLAVSIGHTNHDIIHWFRDNFGGSVYTTFKRNSHPTHKSTLFWHLTKMSEKEPFLRGILPYLKIKTKQANLGLEFIEMRGNPDPAKRNQLVEACQILNRRGKSVETTRQAPDRDDDIVRTSSEDEELPLWQRNI